MMLLRKGDKSIASRIGSDNCTPRTQTVSDRILSLRPTQQASIAHDRIKS